MDVPVSSVYGTFASQCSAVSGSVTPGPHAVSEADGTRYCYDANGNLMRTFIGTSTTSDKTLTWTAYDKVATIGSSQLNTKVGFDYGPNREKIRRIDYSGFFGISASKVTHYVGGAEVRWNASGSGSSITAGTFDEVRRYVGGVIIVQRGTGTSQTTQREYLLTDAQGSTYAVLDDYGAVINASARMSFDPFGQRRVVDWSATTPWSVNLGNELNDTTRHGYTGHEQVDAVGIVHMGGRIYDPKLGRFLQADPFIQAPGNSQSLNRYTYVFNNPLAYTDPTGYWGAKEQAGLRTVVAIVIACYTGYYAANIATTTTSAYTASFIGGFAAGAVQSGTLKGAVVGGISAVAFYGIGQKFSTEGLNITSGEGLAAYSKLALASGVTSGVLAEMQGGRFGNAFITAGASTFLAPIPEAASSSPGMQTVVAAVVGGTISEIGGGKFANGAVTSAFQFALGRAIRGGHERSSRTKFGVYAKGTIRTLSGKSYDSYSDLSYSEKASAAVAVVLESCSDCMLPIRFSLEEMPLEYSGHTSLTGHITFNSSHFEFDYPDAALDALTDAFHEVAHTQQNFIERVKGGLVDTFSRWFKGDMGEDAWLTREHRAIYKIAPIAAAANIRSYYSQLDAVRSGKR